MSDSRVPLLRGRAVRHDPRVTRHPRSSRRPRPRWLAVALGVLLVGLASTVVLASAGAGPDRCQRLDERSVQRWALVTGPSAAPRVLAVGDSWSVGASLPMAQSWPTLLPGRVRVDGFGGSGFSRFASPCGDRSYATRLASSLRSRPDVVVLEGGLNDTDRPTAELVRGVDRAARVLRQHRVRPAQVLVVGPAPAPARPAAAVREVDEQLRRAALGHGFGYLSMLGEDHLSYLPDRLHPDAAGQRSFGARVAASVATMLPGS